MTTVPEVSTQQITNGVTQLNLLQLGNPARPSIIMLHGLRDTAWSLLPIAQTLATPEPGMQGYHVVIPELRGHGSSGTSEAYAMSNFLLDLHCVVETVGKPCALFGHSLGGHLVTKYAALFKPAVAAVMIVEGLGPPRRPHVGDEAAELNNYKQMLLTRMGPRRQTSTPIRDPDEAAGRLMQGNPRLSESEAYRISSHLIKPIPGGYQWCFDSAANSVFVGTNPDQDAAFWRGVAAPTCIVSGALSYEYWARQMSQESYTGKFAEGEIEHRVGQFTHAQHHWFENSGHMVHYDEPERLAMLAKEFYSIYYTG